MTALLNILATVFWFVKRWFVKKDDPQAQYQEKQSENAKIIATANQGELNVKLSALTGRLPDDKAGGDTQ